MGKNIKNYLVIALAVVLFLVFPIVGILFLLGYLGFNAIMKYKQSGLGAVLIAIGVIGGIVACIGYIPNKLNLNDGDWTFMASDHKLKMALDEISIAKVIAIVSVILIVFGMFLILLQRTKAGNNTDNHWKSSVDLNDSENVVICTQCGKRIPSDAAFCSYCGYHFSVCSECGTRIPAGANFCPKCGHSANITHSPGK